MLGIVDMIADGRAAHGRIISLKEAFERLIFWGLFGEPVVIMMTRQDDRHALVDGTHQGIGGRGNQSAGIKNLVVMLPLFPQPSKCKRLLILALNMEGLLAGYECLPFIKPRCGDEASSMFESSSKSRFFADGFHARIKKRWPACSLFCP